MYDRLYKHLSNSKILFPKQFGFQKGHSIDHALLHLLHQIYESFERNEYTVGVFVDLSKVFDTAEKIRRLRHISHTSSVVPELLKQQETVYSVWSLVKNKLQNCEMRCSTRIYFRTSAFSAQYQRSSVRFWSSWPYYVCWRHKFVLLKQGYKYCFSQSKPWLTKNQWFISNKLSSNVKITKYSFFHKPSKKDDIPLVLPKLNINNSEITSPGLNQ